MSFLEELENNSNNKEPQKTPRQLWESCFKYFNHFISILNKNKDEFEVDFNFTLLNIEKKCIVMGPYEISRMQTDQELSFEVRFITQIDKNIKIKTKDRRQAELLQVKLGKGGLLSNINTDIGHKNILELNSNIKSLFSIKLINNSDFYLHYNNVCSSTKRSLKLSPEQVNEATMDKIARYILGQNPNLYKESISNQEITKIRENLELEKQRILQKEADIRLKIKEEEELEEIRKNNTLKEKSKRYLLSKKDKVKSSFLKKLTDLRKQ